MQRSLKGVYKAATVETMFRLGPSQIHGRARALSWAVAPCGARLLDLAWTDFPAGIIAE
jgi:hypothetical protein